MSRLEEVLEFVISASDRLSADQKQLLRGVIDLDADIYYMDYNDYEEFLSAEDDMLEYVEDCLLG